MIYNLDVFLLIQTFSICYAYSVKFLLFSQLPDNKSIMTFF